MDGTRTGQGWANAAPGRKLLSDRCSGQIVSGEVSLSSVLGRLRSVVARRRVQAYTATTTIYVSREPLALLTGHVSELVDPSTLGVFDVRT